MPFSGPVGARVLDVGPSRLPAVAASRSYQATILNDGPDVYYRLDESGSGPFIDVAHNHNATPSGTITSAAGLIPGDSLDPATTFSPTFKGTVAGTYNGAFATSMTVEMWVRLSSVAADQYFVQNTVSGFTGYSVMRAVSGAKWQWISHGVAAFPFTTTPLSVGQLQHVVMVARSGVGVDLYLDGVFQQTVGGADGLTPTEGLFLGHSGGTASPSGDVDEIAIYKYALSAAQIFQHYIVGITPQAGAATPSAVTPAAAGVSFDGSGSVTADTTIPFASAGVSFGGSGTITAPTSITPASGGVTFSATGSITAPTAVTPAAAGVSFGGSGSITGPARVSGTSGVTFSGSGSISAPTSITPASSGVSFSATGSITAPTTITFAASGVAFGGSGSVTAPALIGQFPRVGSLDEFNAGSSQALTARTGWNASPLRTGDASLATDSVPTTAVASATAGNLWDDPAVPDSETWLTLAAYNPSIHQVYTCARVTVQGALTAYALQIGNGSTFQLLKFVAGSPSILGSSGAITCAPGDSVGISVVGNRVSSYYRPVGGVWALVATVTDNSITASGKYGGFFCSSGVAIDRIGGGIYVVGSAESGVSFSGSGTITASSTPFISGTAGVSFSASGSITAPTGITPAASGVSFGSSGSLTAPTFIVGASSGVAFSGSGAITAPTFIVAATSGVSFGASGSITAPTFITGGTAGVSFSGTGGLARFIVPASTGVSFAGTGSITSPTTITFAASGVAFGGSGSITSTSTPFISGMGGVSFSASGALTAPTGITPAAGGVSFSGSGTLSSPTKLALAASGVAFGATGILAAPTRITFGQGGVSFGAIGTITAFSLAQTLTQPFATPTPDGGFDPTFQPSGAFDSSTPVAAAFEATTPASAYATPKPVSV